MSITITITIVIISTARYIYFGGLTLNPLNLTESLTWAWLGAMFKLVLEVTFDEHFLKMGGNRNLHDFFKKPTEYGATSLSTMEDKLQEKERFITSDPNLVFAHRHVTGIGLPGASALRQKKAIYNSYNVIWSYNPKVCFTNIYLLIDKFEKKL